MYDGRMIYLYKNVVFFVRASKDWAYLFNNDNEYIGMAVNNFDSVQRLADWYLENIA
jgi:hypothetical protein